MTDNTTPPDLAALEFALGPEVHLPWTVEEMRTTWRVTNAAAIFIAECYNPDVAAFIVAAANSLEAQR